MRGMQPLFLVIETLCHFELQILLVYQSLKDTHEDTLSYTTHDSTVAQEASLHAQVAAAAPLTAPAPTPGAAAPILRPKADTMMACRYELKYRIPESTARAIAAYIKPILPPDRYAQLRHNGESPITSL